MRKDSNLKRFLAFIQGIGDSEFVDYSNIMEQVEKCRKINFEIITDTLGEVREENLGEWILSGEQKYQKLWISDKLPKFPEKELGKVAEIYLCDEEIEHEKTKKKTIMRLIQISYFHDAYPDEGLTDDFDFYHFVGYKRSEIEQVAEKMAEYWNLKKSPG